ncbi:MAG: phosphatidylcholine/phosphatidylserine synthase [Kiritimatiellae bacterium]|nr:phosphatidylcholine/phosphatidylserine synthase [Kiritimatiellia bacterium]
MSKFRLRGRRRKNRPASHDRIPLRSIVPNLITSIAACAGITSITISATNYAKTLAGKAPATPRDWFMGLLALLVACICDAMDGRVARLLNASSKLGAELDSLADFVNFGVAPAIYMYFWYLSGRPDMPQHLKNLLLGAALFYALCDAFRLARFNTMLEQPTIPYWKNFFLGVPAPGGCWMVLTPAILTLAFAGKESAPFVHNVSNVFQNPWFGMSMLLFIGVLMASRLPTISLKSLHISRPYLLPTMAACLLLIAFLATNFWLTLGVVGAGYILTVPFVGLVFLKVRAKYLRDHGDSEFEAAPPPPATAA